MNDNNNITGPKHFKQFKKYVNKYIEYFGLYGWALYFQHEEYVNDNSLASVCPDIDSKTAVFNLSPNWQDVNMSKKLIRKVAFHEVMELFLYKLRCIASSRFKFTEADLEEEIHNLIRIMENRILKKCLKK